MSAVSAKGKKKESARARRKRILKEREKGFDVAPRASSAKPAEYDAFKDPNMQQYFSQPHVRDELARSGLIKAIKSPINGEDPMWVPTNTPKKIFFTKKDPVAAKREKALRYSPLSVLIKRKDGEQPEEIDRAHSMKELLPTRKSPSSKSAPTSPTTKTRNVSSKSTSDLSFTSGSKLAGRFAEWDKAKQNAARLDASGVSQGGLSESQQNLLDDLSAAPSMSTRLDAKGTSGRPPRMRKSQSMKDMAIALGAADEVVADFLANESEVAQLWSSEKRKTHFLVSTWGKLQSRDRARAEAEKYVKRQSSRQAVPSQKKKKKIVHDPNGEYVVKKQMDAKKMVNFNRADEAERKTLMKQMSSVDEEDRRIRTMRAAANTRLEDASLSTSLNYNYTPDLFGTRGNYFESLMYMARMTPAREHKSKNPWDLIKDEPKEKVDKKDGVIKGLSQKRTLAMSICNLTWNPRERHAVLEEGALDALAILAKVPDEEIRLRCAIAYHNLSRSPDCRSEILENKHAVSLLVELAKNEEVEVVVTIGDDSSADHGETLIQLHAVSALANLSCVLGSEPQLLNKGVLHVAMRITKSQEHELVETHDLVSKTNILLVSRALCNLTNIIGQRPRLVTEGVVGASGNLLGHQIPEVTRNVVLSLLNLSTSKGELRSTMIRQGVVDTLLSLVVDGKKPRIARDAKSSQNLSAKDAQQQQLWDKENRQRSIMALSTLSTGGKQGPAADDAAEEDQNDEQGITRQVLPIVMSLSKSGDHASRMRCSSALRSLSITRSNLQLLLNAGAIEVCFEMARMERQSSPRQITPSEFNCMVVICNVLVNASTKSAAIKLGAVSAILPCLRDNNIYALDLASATLFNLVKNRSGVSWQAASSEECMIALLALSRIGSPSTVWRSASTLSLLLSEPSIVEKVVQNSEMREKMISVLVSLLGAEAEEDQEVGSDIGGVGARGGPVLPRKAADMVRRCAVVTLASLAKTDNEELRYMIADKAIDRLIPMATSGDTTTKLWLISLLCLLSFSPSSCEIIVHRGGCTALGVLSNLADPQAAEQISILFQNLSAADDVRGAVNQNGGTRQRMVQDGVVVSLLGLCSSHDEETRLHCVSALCNLGCLVGSETTIVNQGAISELMIVALVRAITDRTKVVCAQTLMNLLVEKTADYMIREGLIWALSELSKLKGYPGVVRAAAVAFAVIVSSSNSRKRLIQEKGAIHSLMKLLRIDDAETRSLCWKTFGRIIVDTGSEGDDNYGDDDFEEDDRDDASDEDDDKLTGAEKAQNKVMKRLVEEGVLAALAAIVKSDDESLKTNSAAILALLCTKNTQVRRETGGQAMQLVAALTEQSLQDESTRQYCVDALHALASDNETRSLLNDMHTISGSGLNGVHSMKILLALASHAKSTHTEVLCSRTLYEMACGVDETPKAKNKKGSSDEVSELQAFADSVGEVNDSVHALATSPELIPLLQVLARNTHDDDEPLLLMAVIRSVSWDRRAAPELVRQGIVGLLGDLVETAIDRHSGTDGHSINSTSRLDCVIACRNFAEACGHRVRRIREAKRNNPKAAAYDDEEEEDLHARMESDGALERVLYRVMEGQDGQSLEMRRYFAQSLCWMTSSQKASTQMISQVLAERNGEGKGSNEGSRKYSEGARSSAVVTQNVVARLCKLLHGGGAALTREAIVAMHNLALVPEGPKVCLDEGVFDIVTTLGKHSDKVIRFSCESVLQLLSTLLKGVRKGTLSKVIALCLQDELSTKNRARKDGTILSGTDVEGKEGGADGIEGKSSDSGQSNLSSSMNMDSRFANEGASASEDRGVTDALRATEPLLACPFAERPGTWALSRKAFSFNVFHEMKAPPPQETPFTKLSQNFTAPVWEKVHFSGLKKKPVMAETPAIVRPDTSKISETAEAALDVNINVSVQVDGTGNSAVDADRIEFSKDEPSVDSAWDDESVATNHKKILHARRNERLAEFGVQVPSSPTGAQSEGKTGGILPKIDGASSDVSASKSAAGGALAKMRGGMKKKKKKKKKRY
eukprot:g4016.t1